ncbi:MAG: WecB/TagA/CpsF family glycosyltransferase [Candidatus Omnitrophica bacterium]|nr:WecB/TagA/CpsF family glycosyltransferase [Candidatus Omnitrophota bacterium]
MDAQVDAYLKLAQDLVLNSKKQHQLKNKSYCHIGGVRIDSTSYKDAISKILDLTQEEKGANIIIANAHLVYEARKNKLKDIINSAELVTPDGLPLLWAQKLSEMKKGKKVSGPDLFPLLCKEAEKKKIPVGFYGAKEDILDKLIKKIKREFPNLDLRYSYSPPFRPLTDAEDQKVIRDINRSGAKILFVGLGCPKQEIWAGMHKHKINAVMVTVGAAFDFIAGSKKRAPKWMQKAGLEWLYRLITEPRRLWRRYLVGNSYFMYLLSKKIIKKIFSNKRKNKYEN